MHMVHLAQTSLIVKDSLNGFINNLAFQFQELLLCRKKEGVKVLVNQGILFVLVLQHIMLVYTSEMMNAFMLLKQVMSLKLLKLNISNLLTNSEDITKLNHFDLFFLSYESKIIAHKLKFFLQFEQLNLYIYMNFCCFWIVLSYKHISNCLIIEKMLNNLFWKVLS